MEGFRQPRAGAVSFGGAVAQRAGSAEGELSPLYTISAVVRRQGAATRSVDDPGRRPVGLPRPRCRRRATGRDPLITKVSEGTVRTKPAKVLAS
jgi:hypothetical protein